jgi:hypothetical protein
MFESVEARSKHRPWRAFGIVSAIFFAALWLVLHVRAEQENDRVEEARAERQKVWAENDKPRILKTAGLEVEVPRLEESREGGDTRGSVSAGGGLHAYGLVWEPGALDTAGRTHATVMVRGVVEGQVRDAHATEHVRTIGGLSGYEVRLSDARGKLAALLLLVPCGGRRITLFVTGDDARPAIERMAETFRCVSVEKVPLQIPVAVDHAPGWRQAPGKDPGILDGPHDLRLQTNLLERREGSVAAEVVDFFRGSHFTLHEPPSTRNDKVFYGATLVTNGTAYNAAILAWRCPDDRVAVIVVTSATASLDPGILLADTGRCLAPDEPMPTY